LRIPATAHAFERAWLATLSAALTEAAAPWRRLSGSSIDPACSIRPDPALTTACAIGDSGLTAPLLTEPALLRGAIEITALTASSTERLA
jgi:hypothetical protein